MKCLNQFNLLTIIFLILLGACTSNSTKIERPREAWIMRSVLDKKPRMLSIALNKKLWLAYNTQTAALYKAWIGIVNYDGSVYNGVHGFQPTSQGITFIQEPDENPWKIISNDKMVVPEVIYRGHAIKDNQVSLKYDLKYNNQKISVEEKPEYFPIPGDTSNVGFERAFTVSGAPSGVQVALAMHLSSLASENDYKTNGKFNVSSKSVDEIQEKQFLNLEGILLLNSNATTTLSVNFSPKLIQDKGEKVLEGEEAALALMAKSDCSLCHNEDVKTVGPAYIDIARRYKRYPNANEYINRVALKIINGGAGNWGSIPMTPHPDLTLADATTLASYILSLKAKENQEVKSTAKQKEISEQLIKKDTIPGDEFPLESVHPSFDLAQARPGSFKPKVGGMDFLPDGRLVVSTWDSLGSVFILDGVQEKDPEAIKVKKIATGLAEPLGVKVVDNEIYVMQKQELTKLVDLNNDDIIDEYQTICAGWKVSDNFHEFAFGLVYKGGYFYGTLATAINKGGASTQPQVPNRGKVVKISRKDGSFSFIASGLRTPNGIGLGVDNEIFIADNQGDWLPANKIVHLQEGAWYGSRSVDFEGTKDLTETPPVVWLQQHEIGNSPSQPTILNVGPYRNQMIHGDVHHGGIKRVFIEKVNGTYQGAVFRFTQGLEAGVNRLVWGPDGVLYMGGVGLGGNWSHNGKRYGLQKLTFNNNTAFEMLAIRAKANGVEIEFTEPLKEGVGIKASDYSINQWWYKPTANYGGPKMDEEQLKINNIQVSSDRKKVFLQLAGMKPKHVVYIRLNRKTIVNSDDRNLWSTEAWYTLNNIPSEKENLAVKD